MIKHFPQGLQWKELEVFLMTFLLFLCFILPSTLYICYPQPFFFFFWLLLYSWPNFLLHYSVKCLSQGSHSPNSLSLISGETSKPASWLLNQIRFQVSCKVPKLRWMNMYINTRKYTNVWLCSFLPHSHNPGVILKDQLQILYEV